jgi:hypothetical protein
MATLDSPRVTHAPSPQLTFAPPSHEKFGAEALAIAESTSAPRAPRAWRPPQLQLPPSNSELTTTATSAAVVASGGGGRRPRQQRTEADYHTLLTSAGLQVRVKRTGGGYCDQPYTADELLERAAQLGDEVQRLTAERDEYGTTLRDERAARAEAELAGGSHQAQLAKLGMERRAMLDMLREAATDKAAASEELGRSLSRVAELEAAVTKHAAESEAWRAACQAARLALAEMQAELDAARSTGTRGQERIEALQRAMGAEDEHIGLLSRRLSAQRDASLKLLSILPTPPAALPVAPGFASESHARPPVGGVFAATASSAAAAPTSTDASPFDAAAAAAAALGAATLAAAAAPAAPAAPAATSPRSSLAAPGRLLHADGTLATPLGRPDAAGPTGSTAVHTSPELREATGTLEHLAEAVARARAWVRFGTRWHEHALDLAEGIVRIDSRWQHTRSLLAETEGAKQAAEAELEALRAEHAEACETLQRTAIEVADHRLRLVEARSAARSWEQMAAEQMAALPLLGSHASYGATNSSTTAGAATKAAATAAFGSASTRPCSPPISPTATFPTATFAPNAPAALAFAVPSSPPGSLGPIPMAGAAEAALAAASAGVSSTASSCTSAYPQHSQHSPPLVGTSVLFSPAPNAPPPGSTPGAATSNGAVGNGRAHGRADADGIGVGDGGVGVGVGCEGVGGIGSVASRHWNFTHRYLADEATRRYEATLAEVDDLRQLNMALQAELQAASASVAAIELAKAASIDREAATRREAEALRQVASAALAAELKARPTTPGRLPTPRPRSPTPGPQPTPRASATSPPTTAPFRHMTNAGPSPTVSTVRSPARVADLGLVAEAVQANRRSMSNIFTEPSPTAPSAASSPPRSTPTPQAAPPPVSAAPEEPPLSRKSPRRSASATELDSRAEVSHGGRASDGRVSNGVSNGALGAGSRGMSISSRPAEEDETQGDSPWDRSRADSYGSGPSPGAIKDSLLAHHGAERLRVARVAATFAAHTSPQVGASREVIESSLEQQRDARRRAYEHLKELRLRKEEQRAAW